jgi:bifunctional DNase/RNase
MDLMVVKTVRPSSTGDEVMVVLQTSAGDRYLGFLAPLNEANRLARVLGMSGCRCAPIYELLLDLATASQVDVRGAVLDACPEGIGATLVFRREGTEMAIECHPADAVAMAVRTGTPIHATAAAIALSCPADAHPDQPDEATARWLAAVRPSDFERPLA